MPWQELKRLQACCEVKIESFMGRENELRWRMEVRKRGSNQPPPIRTEAHEIADAVRDGVERALDAQWMEASEGQRVG